MRALQAQLERERDRANKAERQAAVAASQSPAKAAQYGASREAAAVSCLTSRGTS